MGMKIPALGTELRESISHDQFVAMARRQWEKFPVRADFVRRGVEYIASTPGVRSIISIVQLADGRLVMAELGPQGGVKVRHTFGKIGVDF
jgi:hypothetical protein